MDLPVKPNHLAPNFSLRRIENGVEGHLPPFHYSILLVLLYLVDAEDKLLY